MREFPTVWLCRAESRTSMPQESHVQHISLISLFQPAPRRKLSVYSSIRASTLRWIVELGYHAKPAVQSIQFRFEDFQFLPRIRQMIAAQFNRDITMRLILIFGRLRFLESAAKACFSYSEQASLFLSALVIAVALPWQAYALLPLSLTCGGQC